MKKLVFASLLVLILASCSDKKQEHVVVKPEFTTYVSAFTGGIVSNQSSIFIEFKNDVPGVKINSPVQEGSFSFFPSVDGEALWIDARTIQFTPKTSLESGTVYKANFQISNFIQLPSDLSEFEFSFETKPLYSDIYFESIEPYSNEELTWQKLSGKVICSDFVSNEDIEQAVDLSNIGSSFSWFHDAEGINHQFIIDSVERKESSYDISLSVDNDILKTENQAILNVEIPALGDFKLLSINSHQSPNQYVSLIFSDPVNSTQDITGLLYLGTGQRIQVIKNGNELKIYPQTRVTGQSTLFIKKSVTNSLGYELQEEYEEAVVFQSIEPQIQLLGDGVIIPGNDKTLFPFKAVNLSSVHVRILKVFEDNVMQFFQSNTLSGSRELKRVGRVVYSDDVALSSYNVIDYSKWNNFSIDLSKLIRTEPGSVYRIELSMRQEHSLYPCDDEEELEEGEKQQIYTIEEENAFYDNPNGYYYYSPSFQDNYTNYTYRDRHNPCRPSYYIDSRKKVSQNVLSSNFGIIAKSNDNNDYQFFVTDLRTAAPISDAKVEIYNFQQQLISSSTSDSEGKVTFSEGKKAFIAVVSKGVQKGYLKLDDGSSLSTSMFDVDGAKNTKGIKGFIYGERGVWRPGDSLFVSFILEDKYNNLPENHPVIFELEDPQGTIIEKIISNEGLNGFYAFKTKTEQEALTGNYTARVKVGGNIFTEYLKIENIKPNRLKIKIDFENDVLKNKVSNLTELNVKWLHGAVAKNLKADVEVQLSKTKTSFDKFKGYQFDDQSKTFYGTTESIFDGQLDEKGNAKFSTQFDVASNAPGMLKAKFKIRAFEAGGDFSVDRFSKKISPYNQYVGIKIPEGRGWRGALMTDEANVISIATVNENGEKIDNSNLTIEVYKLDWRWWWDRSGDDYLSNYINNQDRYRIYSSAVSTKDGKTLHEIKFNRNYWGRGYIRIVDNVSGHSAGQMVYFDYSGWWDDPQAEKPGGAEMLSFSTNKDEFEVGETVTVNFPSPENGKALVSLENGSQIVETFWVDCVKGNTSFSFETNENMTPNVFVNVALIQPHNQTSNDLPIRLYGIQNIKIHDSKTILEPVLDMADVLEPEKPVKINVSEKNGRKMTFTVALVDEGILDLTRFKTPDPHSHFYKNEALGIKSYDMYQYVMGAFSGELSGLLELGGDEEGNANGGKKAMRFKPVVMYFGPFEIDANESKNIEFIMPNYIGSVRTYVVAGQDQAYGRTEKATPVRKPVMLLSSLPRVIGPGESFKLPVTVFAMENGVKDVKVELSTNKFFQTETTTQTIHFDEPGDQTVYFDLSTIKELGIGEVKVKVSSGKHSAYEENEIDIRVANPRATKTEYHVVGAGESIDYNISLFGMKGTNELSIEASSLPPINLNKRLNYLIRYPHGCVEQTTSSVFPQLYLNNLIELSPEKANEVKSNIRAGIKRLSTFQTESGGFAYWPNYYYDASEWGSNYAGHFLVEAKHQGYNLPEGMLTKWVKFQKDRANAWAYNQHHYHGDLIQAYRLYTLALSGNPALGAMNRFRNEKRLSIQAKWRLAAAYALVGKKHISNEIIESLTEHIEPYKELSNSFGSHYRDYAMILETLLLLDRPNDSFLMLKKISDAIGSERWYSTQTTAYSLLAVGKYVKNNKMEESLKFDLNINGISNNIVQSSSIYLEKVDIVKNNKGSVKLKNKGTAPIFVRINNSGIPMEDGIEKEESNLKMDVKYVDLNGKTIDPTNLEQGTDFKALVTISNPGVVGHYKEMALSQIFPSGWEIRNLRMDDWNGSVSAQYTYQDIKDDRVYFYFDLNSYQSKTFEVYLHASYVGKYYLPAVYSEAMYDEEIHASEPGKWINVTAVD